MTTPNEDQLKDLAATYAKGVTLAVLANQFGVSIPTVTKWVKKGGGTIRSRGQRKKGTATVQAAPSVEDLTLAVDKITEAVGIVTEMVKERQTEAPSRQIFQG